MAAGGEADERWSTIGDTVDIFFLIIRWPAIGDTVKKSSSAAE